MGEAFDCLEPALSLHDMLEEERTSEKSDPHHSCLSTHSFSSATFLPQIKLPAKTGPVGSGAGDKELHHVGTRQWAPGALQGARGVCQGEGVAQPSVCTAWIGGNRFGNSNLTQTATVAPTTRMGGGGGRSLFEGGSFVGFIFFD